MKMNIEQWRDALVHPPNYDVSDFSVGHIEVEQTHPSNDVEHPLNLVHIKATHNGTGLDVSMTLRLPDHIVPAFALSVERLAAYLDEKGF